MVELARPGACLVEPQQRVDIGHEPVEVLGRQVAHQGQRAVHEVVRVERAGILRHLGQRLRQPPLRERGDDVVRLASAFARRFATKMGRTIAPLTADYARRLKGYSWPGNVRELQNVIERAVITAADGQLNLDRALPEATTTLPSFDRTSEPGPGLIRTAKELEDLERGNIMRALDVANWKISGEKGAAALLGMNASTLSSRMKVLKIQKPTAQ